MRTKILAISGKLGSGKTTLETILREALDMYIRDYAFADGLKHAYAEIFAADVGDAYSAAGKAKIIPEMNISVGKFLQDFGEAGRQYCPDIWLFRVGRKITADRPQLAIITDCRFPNEVAYIQSIGGVVLRLERPAHLIAPEALAGRDPNHISETALDHMQERVDDGPGFDRVIKNDKSLDELRDVVVAWLASVF